MSERILLKLGGSILTEKGNPGVAKSKCIEDVAQLISRHTGGQICIVHGAGSFGHPEAHLYNLASGGYGLHLAEGIVRTHDAVCALERHPRQRFSTSGQRSCRHSPSRIGRFPAWPTCRHRDTADLRTDASRHRPCPARGCRHGRDTGSLHRLGRSDRAGPRGDYSVHTYRTGHGCSRGTRI